MKVRRSDIESVPWKPVRPALTRSVEGKDLLPEGMSAQKVVLTRVAPGGEFLPHIDGYHHVLFVLEGSGEVCAGEKVFAMQAGTLVEIPAGERHSYRNTGDGDLVLMTLNFTLNP